MLAQATDIAKGVKHLQKSHELQGQAPSIQAAHLSAATNRSSGNLPE